MAVSGNSGPGIAASKLKNPQKPKATRVQVGEGASASNPLSCVSAPATTATANPSCDFGGIGCPFWSWHQRLPSLLQLALPHSPNHLPNLAVLHLDSSSFCLCCYSISRLLVVVPSRHRAFRPSGLSSTTLTISRSFSLFEFASSPSPLYKASHSALPSSDLTLTCRSHTLQLST